MSAKTGMCQICGKYCALCKICARLAELFTPWLPPWQQRLKTNLALLIFNLILNYHHHHLLNRMVHLPNIGAEDNEHEVFCDVVLDLGLQESLS